MNLTEPIIKILHRIFDRKEAELSQYSPQVERSGEKQQVMPPKGVNASNRIIREYQQLPVYDAKTGELIEIRQV